MAKQKRITVDIKEILEQIDQYPEQAGVQREIWEALTYPQKLLLLAKKGLASAQNSLDEIED